MKHLSLAARYRPQTFAQVAGQDMVKAVLSRAAAEDRPAAAYLLSGTRGVGKTTIARIFAKALNCEHAPGPEPCNECAQCRKITQGAHVDVTEIDGASNNSVEDARSLRETIGYAPMEGRYKIFIIDEAHMLTRNAFNALLKTLEEPPERVVFIFATTEAHKFPVTIVSRCQHFVFRHLSEDALAEHLSAVLRKEKMEFEEGAVRLLARRAAGSVRDGMSLLDQALALGGASLTTAMTREVLGLAGQELFGHLFEALHGRDCAAVADLSRQILQQGVDIGFFVRELAGNLRNLFLLRQGGAAVLPNLRLPADEAAFQQALAPRFSAGHLHAAWQMTLDAQRGIVQSPEPTAALELLLLNLALLPQLLPLEHLPEQEAVHVPSAVPPVQAPSAPDTREPRDRMSASDGQAAPEARNFSAAAAPRPGPPQQSATPPSHDAPPSQPAQRPAPRGRAPEKAAAPEPEAEQEPDPAPVTASEPAVPPAVTGTSPEAATDAEADAGQAARPSFQRDWQAFCEFCAAEQAAGRPAPQPHLLRGLGVDWQEDRLRLTPKAQTLLHQLEKQRDTLEAALAAFGVGAPRLELIAPRPPRGEAELIEEFSKKPELQPCLEVLQASIIHCTEIK
ncbi:DNA polymerase III subunit gamma/tau [Desulfovibrio porci]|uniref:DNA polymerase III subunit gamma/tau n=1 Tax=Desulfovibrio porci TaxID=2605782 RepID=UPI003899CF1B